jgi:pyrroloquinoline quinone biosynthesis protein E
MRLASVLLNSWRIRRTYRDLPLVSSSLPARADIEPTTYCNFRCPHCPTAARPDAVADGDVSARTPRVHLTLADFRRVLDQLPTVYRIKLVGLGEPLLNPDFFGMVREARRRRVRVLTTINGSLLDLDRRRELLACGLHHLNISIDAADPETHARLRPGSDLEQISEGIGALVRERGRAHFPKIRIWHVIQRESTPEIPALVQRCIEWGVDALLCTAKLTNFGSDSMEQVVRERRAVADDLQRMLPQARLLAQAARLEFHCPSAPPPPTNPFDGRPCKWPWSRTFITASGRVSPCPYTTGPDGLILGDLLDRSDPTVGFQAAWNGPEMQRLREAVRTHRNPSFCRACYSGWTGPDGCADSTKCDAAG